MNIHVDLDHRYGNMSFDVEISEGDLGLLHKSCGSVQQIKWKLYDLSKLQDEERTKVKDKQELDAYVNLISTPSSCY